MFTRACREHPSKAVDLPGHVAARPRRCGLCGNLRVIKEQGLGTSPGGEFAETLSCRARWRGTRQACAVQALTAKRPCDCRALANADMMDGYLPQRHRNEITLPAAPMSTLWEALNAVRPRLPPLAALAAVGARGPDEFWSPGGTCTSENLLFPLNPPHIGKPAGVARRRWLTWWASWAASLWGCGTEPHPPHPLADGAALATSLRTRLPLAL